MFCISRGCLYGVVMTTERRDYLPVMDVIDIIMPTCCEACYTRIFLCGTATPSEDILSELPEGAQCIGDDITYGDSGYLMEFSCGPLRAHLGPFHSHTPRLASTGEWL